LEEIRNSCNRRKVKALYHFTNAENLRSIFEENGLFARTSFDENNISDVIFGDTRRMDNYLDRISVSISHPNIDVMWAQRKHVRGDHVVIRLAPEILWELDCLFFCHNAASENIKAVNFDVLFRTPKCKYPMSNQAEVMVKDHIPLEYFKKQIVVYSSEIRERLNERLGIREFEFLFQVDKHLFIKR
jgi:hypothetical protein